MYVKDYVRQLMPQAEVFDTVDRFGPTMLIRISGLSYSVNLAQRLEDIQADINEIAATWRLERNHKSKQDLTKAVYDAVTKSAAATTAAADAFNAQFKNPPMGDMADAFKLGIDTTFAQQKMADIQAKARQMGHNIDVQINPDGTLKVNTSMTAAAFKLFVDKFKKGPTT